MRVHPPLKARFYKKFIVHPGSRCWIWTASLRGDFKGGYGQIGLDRRRGVHDAHRVSWLLHHGEIPTGMCVLHKCDNPKCVNPEHLFLGTRTENTLDMITKGRGHWQRVTL